MSGSIAMSSDMAGRTHSVVQLLLNKVRLLHVYCCTLSIDEYMLALLEYE